MNVGNESSHRDSSLVLLFCSTRSSAAAAAPLVLPFHRLFFDYHTLCFTAKYTLKAASYYSPTTGCQVGFKCAMDRCLSTVGCWSSSVRE